MPDPLIVLGDFALALLDEFYPDSLEGRFEKVAFNRVAERLRVALRSSARGVRIGVIPPGQAVANGQDAIVRWFREGFISGLEVCDVDPEEMTDEENNLILSTSLTSAFAWENFINELAANGENWTLRRTLARTDLYVNDMRGLFNSGKASGCSNRMLIWNIGATEEHCRDCLFYDGQVHRATTWERYGAIPQRRSLECRGYNCDCSLEPTTRRASGRLREPTHMGVVF